MNRTREIFFINIIKRDDIIALRSLFKRGLLLPNFDYYRTAMIVSNGQSTKCLKYLHQIGRVGTHQLMLDSAYYGNISLMDYAHRNAEPINYQQLIKPVLQSGNLACLFYIMHFADMPFPDKITILDKLSKYVHLTVSDTPREKPASVYYTKYPSFRDFF